MMAGRREELKTAIRRRPSRLDLLAELKTVVNSRITEKLEKEKLKFAKTREAEKKLHTMHEWHVS